MIKLKGKIVPGSHICSKTIKQQSPFFEGKINKKALENGSINIDISPKKWEIVKPDFSFTNVVWRPNFPEDFSFIKIKFRFENKIYKGFLYNPKRTKNPKTMMEILSDYIKEIKYDKEIELYIPKNKIKFF